MERRAIPVHTVIDSIFDSGTPVSFGQRVVITDNIANRMTVLEASELTFSITNTQYQVASSFGRFHAMNRFIKSFIPLQDISEDKGEGISESALFSKGRVWVADTNLGNGELMLIDS